MKQARGSHSQACFFVLRLPTAFVAAMKCCSMVALSVHFVSTSWIALAHPVKRFLCQSMGMSVLCQPTLIVKWRMQKALLLAGSRNTEVMVAAVFGRAGQVWNVLGTQIIAAANCSCMLKIRRPAVLVPCGRGTESLETAWFAAQSPFNNWTTVQQCYAQSFSQQIFLTTNLP